MAEGGPRVFDRDRTTLFFDPDADPVAEIGDGERIVVRTADSICGLWRQAPPTGYHIDEVIATIRASRTTETARGNLRKKFTLTEVQATAILDMRLARLAGLERKKVEDELKEVLAEIRRLETLLGDPKLILGVIRDDMTALKEKYGDERRTRIQDISGALSEEDLIPEVDVLVTLTAQIMNYLREGHHRVVL